jgi:hypothetical protein
MNRIDWPRLLEDIAYMLGEVDESNPAARTPVSTARLAVLLATPRGTLIGWMDGSEPKHADGERLIDRWRVLTGKPREFAPMERRSLTAAQR